LRQRDFELKLIGGSGFGGNYFGTGDSVLKKWWGEEK
jgi:hypothetical protein